MGRREMVEKDNQASSRLTRRPRLLYDTRIHLREGSGP